MRTTLTYKDKLWCHNQTWLQFYERDKQQNDVQWVLKQSTRYQWTNLSDASHTKSGLLESFNTQKVCLVTLPYENKDQ